MYQFISWCVFLIIIAF